VLEEVQSLLGNGYKEIVLTGIHLGLYGRDFGWSLAGLIGKIAEVPRLVRLRLSSLESTEIVGDTDSMLLDVLAAHRDIVCPHFHIPLQSGSDAVLTDMKRRYKTALFADKVHQIKSAMTHACIAVDVISGFPTETEEDFKETFRFLENLPVSYLHVFTYSKRPQTPAAEMKPQVNDSIKKERTKILLQLSEAKKTTFYNEHLHTTRKVLFEDDVKNKMIFGFTDNYIRVSTPVNKQLINQIINIELTEHNIRY
jgi:threonylcarbamoyladenosine tRNA methylthiotransferase MtaB